MIDDMPPWNRFIYTWGRICDELHSQAMYQRHLDEARPGTELAASMGRVMAGTASKADLVAFIRWELWEAIMCLEPWVPRDRGPGWVPRHRPGHDLPHLPHIQDGWHASACVARADAALRRLEKLL